MNSLLEIQRTRFSFRYKSCIISKRQGGEMVDTHGLGPCAERLGGSSPLLGTHLGFKILKLWQQQLKEKKTDQLY